jgi:hypothetical protein
VLARQRRAGEHRAARVEHLRDVVVASGAGEGVVERSARLAHERGDRVGARAQRARDRVVEVGAEAQVEEQSREAEHDRHDDGEGQGQPHPQREPRHRPPSSRRR